MHVEYTDNIKVNNIIKNIIESAFFTENQEDIQKDDIGNIIAQLPNHPELILDWL